MQKTGGTAVAVIVYRVENGQVVEYKASTDRATRRVRVPANGVVRLRLNGLPLHTRVQVDATAVSGSKKSSVRRITFRTPA